MYKHVSSMCNAAHRYTPLLTSRDYEQHVWQSLVLSRCEERISLSLHGPLISEKDVPLSH